MLLNGQPATDISLQDRGLAYGDGLFETILICAGRPLLFDEHLARLQRGCAVLGLDPDLAALQSELASVLSQTAARDVVLKISLTREASGRGYRPLTTACNRILTLHPRPDYRTRAPDQGIAMFVCRQRLARQPVLAGLKHLNRLEQVLASREWPDDSFLEGLMLDTEGLVIEGTRSNLFAVIGGQLLTPTLDNCGVNGVMRTWLLQSFGKVACERMFTLGQLRDASEIFICSSVIGVWPVTQLQQGGELHRYDIGPHTRQAQAWFHALI
jgi:4-amino-4-deoxychorismate lyase